LTDRSKNSSKMVRVALIEATHWHMPLYLPALEDDGVQLIAVSDATGRSAPDLEKRFGCRTYRDTHELLAIEAIDFAFVFGRHAEMPALAAQLIARGIPFAIEKPCGIRANDVAALARDAEARGLFVSVPLIFRQSDLLKVVRDAHGGAPFQIDHASFRFMAGPPGRYPAAGNDWMLDPAIAGGGPLINLGVHFIDLFAELAGEEIATVSASATSHVNKLAIEDAISVRLQTIAGRIGTIECGYTFPSDKTIQREFSFSIRSPTIYVQSHPDGAFMRKRSDSDALVTSVKHIRLETDMYYPEFVRRSLDDAFSGAKPLAGLRDAERALRVVEAAYRSATENSAPVRLSL
jgi:predicted dehydrogenase